MEFRILGPLEAVSEDGPIRVPGAKPRALLALLLVHANRVVSRHRLAEDLWEGSPPRAATATLQSYVYQLRRALKLESLCTRAGGYVLEVKDSDLDALRFEHAVQEVSHAESASSRWVSLRLGEALAWWRGPALCDFAGAVWAHPEADRLEGLRLGAIEDLIAARLALGEHPALVPELGMLVSQHPLRERLWEQLILALYRCDRQAEALRAYQRVRAILAEELGLEPGSGLVGLERRILEHDPTLMAPPPATRGSPTEWAEGTDESGVGLPSPPTSFVGRGAELGEIAGLVDGHRLVTLTGAGGCGKTRLAIEVADRLAGGFADGVRFADLAAVTDEAQVADAVVDAFGLAQDPARQPVGRLATYLHDREMLCVLDNCEHVLDACAALAEAIVTRGGASRLLATSREPLGIVGEQVYVVPSLEVGTEAVCLFADRAAEARAGFVVDDANRGPVTEVCRHLDGIPLAIELAAARSSHLSPAQLLERLDDRLALLRAERRIPRHQTLAATLDWSYELLDGREREVLRCLSVFPASFTLEAAEAVASDDVLDALGSLVAKSLVHVVDDGEQLRYRLLETVRLYAADRFDSGEAERCRGRHRDWVIEWLESIPLAERLVGDTNPFRDEHPNIRAALEWSDAHADVEVVARMAAGIRWSWGEHWRDGTRWCEVAARATGSLPPDVEAQLYVMLIRLGTITLRELGDARRLAKLAQHVITVAGGKPSPAHAEALGFRAGMATADAVERVDESLVRQASDFADACVQMGNQLPLPWPMYLRLFTGTTYSALALIWPRYLKTAICHFAAGIAVAPSVSPYLGQHAELCAQLAFHRFLAGDLGGACDLARQAQRNIALSTDFLMETPLTLAVVLAHESANGLDALEAELRAYHDASRRYDWGRRATEAIVLYGAVLAAMRQNWELACRLLAAGERGRFGSPAKQHLHALFDRRTRAALGSERVRKLGDEGRAMPLADALVAALR